MCIFCDISFHIDVTIAFCIPKLTVNILFVICNSKNRVEWGKAPMWGKGPTTEITFMDGNRGNICTRVFSYVIGPPGRAVADGENTS